jgi:cyclic pyranopterin phosphate synthase
MGAPESALLLDRHGRSKKKLRVSLTDRCQFRCRYCMPETPRWLPREELLSREELARLARLFVHLGIDAIRVTGGEPLLRADVVECVAAFAELRALGLRRLSMSSNAALLARHARELRAAGLDDINISLDSVDPARFQAMTGQPLAPVLEGIAAARAAGLPVKLNAVLMRGYNDAEIEPLVDWALREDLPLRFIEYMPLDAPGRWKPELVVPESEILARLSARWRVSAQPRGREPASLYTLDGRYALGIISTVSNPFCGSCDRLRLTARGELYTCLFARTGTPLGAQLRAGEPTEALQKAIRSAVWNKDAGYAAHPGAVERPVTMHVLGG